jgi:hypothetical protein
MHVFDSTASFLRRGLQFRTVFGACCSPGFGNQLSGGIGTGARLSRLSYNCDLTPMVDRERRRQEVQIENNSDRNLRDLEEMLRSAKTLKRNIRECNEILIGPRFFAYGTVLSFRDDLGIRPDVVSRSEVRTWEGTHMNRTF